MQNKSKNLTDVQLIISSISIALTLGLWSLFASHEKTGASVSGDVLMPSQPDALASNPTNTYPTTLLPGQKLIFGSTAPASQQAQQPQQPAAPTSGKRNRGGGGGGAKTGSSH